jgi:hypothetical protein
MTAEDRENEIHRARVYLGEARRRRHSRADRSFYWLLLGWAANCRARALSALREAAPAQPDLFA